MKKHRVDLAYAQEFLRLLVNGKRKQVRAAKVAKILRQGGVFDDVPHAALVKVSARLYMCSVRGHCVAQAESGPHGPPPPPPPAAVAAKAEAGTPTASTSAAQPERVFFLSSQHEDIVGYALRLSSFATKAVVASVVKTDRWALYAVLACHIEPMFVACSALSDANISFELAVRGLEQVFTLQEAFNTAVRATLTGVLSF